MYDEQSDSQSDDVRTSRRVRLYRVNAIVLRRTELGEMDRLLTLFTLEHGRRRVVAKGARRPGSRIAGHLEPFTATRLLIARTRGLDIISQAETVNPFSHLRVGERAIATSGYFCELVDRLAPEDQPNESVYELLYASLGLLNDGRDARLVRHVFELGLVSQLGYRPDLQTCISCGRAVEPVENGLSGEGGVVCGDCLRYRPDATPISPNALKLLRAIDRGEIERLFGLRVPERIWQELETALSRYILRLTGRESGAQRVLDQLQLE
jgi:DNA repair protein RecO (recombination protein O)